MVRPFASRDGRRDPGACSHTERASRAAPEGRVLHVGDPATLAREVAATGPKAITFNSNGGNVVSAMAYGRMIRSLGLAAFQLRAAQCASACTLAFLGGVIR